MRHWRGRCPVQRSVIILGAASGLFFALCAAATWAGFDPAARAIFAGAGAAAAVLSGICWAVRYRGDADRQWAALLSAARDDRALLIRTLASVAPERRRDLRKTLPIRAR